MNQGDLMGARQREEYAFEVQQRHYGSGLQNRYLPSRDWDSSIKRWL